MMTAKVDSIHIPEKSKKYKRPLFMEPVSAGFPSPAENYMEGKLDLNEHLIKRPAATFFVRVSGDSMINAGIFSGDLLIVDRSIEPADKKVVIAIVEGELTVKRIRIINWKISLIPENESYSPLEINKDTQFEIWGVVTHVIHSL